MPKFIQIVCSSKDYAHYLYALDETGGVWGFDFSCNIWKKMTNERMKGL